MFALDVADGNPKKENAKKGEHKVRPYRFTQSGLLYSQRGEKTILKIWLGTIEVGAIEAKVIVSVATLDG